MSSVPLPATSQLDASPEAAPPLRRAVLRCYRHCPLTTQLFLRLRWRLTPYEAIAARTPRDRVILDLGSGHGLLSLALAMQSQSRQVFGVDHDERRVQLAVRAAAGLPNVHFSVGDLTAALRRPGVPAGAVIVMDGMHYLDFPRQEQLIDQSREALTPGGLLIVREVDTAAGFTSWVNKMHERLMTLCGFTRADQLFFRSAQGWQDLFTSRGFATDSERCGSFPFADRLFVCRKAA